MQHCLKSYYFRFCGRKKGHQGLCRYQTISRLYRHVFKFSFWLWGFRLRWKQERKILDVCWWDKRNWKIGLEIAIKEPIGFERRNRFIVSWWI